MNFIKRKLQSINLDTYNKKLLAIIGTILLVIPIVVLIISLVVGAIVLISEMGRDRETQEVMTVNSEETTTEGGTKPIIRRHEISMEQGQLIDSASATYLIPVGHVRLENEEVLNQNKVTKVIDLNNSGSYGSKVYRGYGSGFYNNILLFKGKTDVTKVLFEQKTIIDDYLAFYFSGQLRVFMLAVQKDSNKDKSLTTTDLKSLYVYGVTDQKMREISKDGYGVLQYQVVQDQNKLMMVMVKDKNSNGEIDYNDPKELFVYHFENEELVPIAGKDQSALMQGMLDK